MQINSLSHQKNLTNSINHNKMNSMNNIKESTKKNNLLQDLMKQKQGLIDHKNSLIEYSLKNNGDPKVLKSKTDEIDKQIKEIEKQISKIQVEDQQKKLNPNKDKDKSKTNKEVKNIPAESSTEEKKQLLAKQLNSIVRVSNSMTKIKFLNKQKNIMTYEKNAISADIAADEARGKATKAKRDLVSKIDEGLDNTNKEISKSTKEMYTEIKKNSRVTNPNKTLNVNEVNNNSDDDTDNNDNTKVQKSLKHKQKIARHAKKHVNTRA